MCILLARERQAPDAARSHRSDRTARAECDPGAAGAVQKSGQGHFVWLVDKDGKAEQRPVTVGDWYDNGWFINEGLHPGDQLVVDGGQRLSNGATVIVTSGKPANGSGSASAPTAAVNR